MNFTVCIHTCMRVCVSVLCLYDTVCCVYVRMHLHRYTYVRVSASVYMQARTQCQERTHLVRACTRTHRFRQIRILYELWWKNNNDVFVHVRNGLIHIQDQIGLVVRRIACIIFCENPAAFSVSIPNRASLLTQIYS